MTKGRIIRGFFGTQLFVFSLTGFTVLAESNNGEEQNIFQNFPSQNQWINNEIPPSQNLGECTEGSSGTVGNLSDDTVVNLREGPGTQFRILAKIFDGETVQILDVTTGSMVRDPDLGRSSDTWLHISYQDQVGYVNGLYVNCVSSTDPVDGEDVVIIDNFVAPADPGNSEVLPTDPVDPVDPAVGPATIQEVQTKVLDPYCVLCHNGTRPAAGLDLSSVGKFINAPGMVVPGNAEQSGLYVSVAIDSRGVSYMPPRAPLSQDLIDLLKSWIDGGAKVGGATISTGSTGGSSGGTTTGGGTTAGTQKKYTFSDIMDKVITPYCVSCHRSQFSNLAKLKSSRSIVPNNPDGSSFYRSIKKNASGKAQMPPRSAMPDNLIEMVRVWIMQGAN